MSQKYKYSYSDDLGIDYADAGPWRSYYLDTYGNTLEELEENATIAEVDQDGGELDCYGIGGAPYQVDKVVTRLLKSLVNES